MKIEKPHDSATPTGAASALSAGLAVRVDPLYVSVRGSEGITFKEGWSTGNMTAPGVQIDTVWYAEQSRAFGGCIDRAEATQIRDWLNSCIAKWDQEKVKANV